MAETGCAVNHSHFFLLFHSVWMEMASESAKIVNGFAATGIFPYNPDAVPNKAYGPSEVYTCTKSGSENADQNDTVTDIADTSEKSAPDYSTNDELAAASLLELSLSLVDLGCVLNEDGTLEKIPVPPGPPVEPSPEVDSVCPPEMALAAVECSITAAQGKCYEVVFETNQELKRDRTFQTWKRLKLAVNSAEPFQTPDPVIPCEDEDVLPNLKLSTKVKSNT
ncbi:uncharacterized protein LOC125652730 isoform X2 [Ostrea edulis]|uniref:uncharacterized protein LOC125652730 isoform X2 n=1 Tax=Ostrea edulis TaxID=37623 RepID=UPI002095EE82|nr:uncharacterized protein LOC125652730 isoform X2 [Ostrea edulis]